jgi:hypothetical protein
VPVPIIAVVLMLTTPRARTNGPAFVLGWLPGLGVVGAVVLALTEPGGASENGQPATWVSWLKLLLGLGLLLLAARQFRGRPHEGEQAPLPRWMAAIDRFTPGQALGGGAALAAANPKNLLLAVGGAGRHRPDRHRRRPASHRLRGLPVAGTLGVGAPFCIYFAMGQTVRGPTGPPEGMDCPQQPRHHGGAVPGHRRQAARRRPQRTQRLTSAGR